MSDRVYIFVLIVFVAFGVYVFQKAKVEQGGIPLLDELIEGKTRKADNSEIVDHTLEAFSFEQQLEDLKKQILTIDQTNQRILKTEERLIALKLRDHGIFEDQVAGQIRLINDSDEKYPSQAPEPGQPGDGTRPPFQQLLKQLGDVLEVCRIIDHELNFFLVNTKGSQQQVNENNKFVRDRTDRLLRDSESLDLKQFAGILRDFDRLESEQLKIRQNLEDHILHLSRRYASMHQLIGQIIGSLRQAKPADFAALAQAHEKAKGPLNEIMTSTISKLQLFDEYMDLSYQVLELAARFHKLDLMSFREEIGLQGRTIVDELLEQREPVSFEEKKRQEFIELYTATEERKRELKRQSLQDEKMLQKILEVYGP